MTTPILMPRMGYDMTEGKIIAWLKKEEEAVQKGEAIAEIETSKVDIDIEAFQSGVLLKILAQPGDTVPVGQPIAIIGEPGEKVETRTPEISTKISTEKTPEPPKSEKDESKSSPLARKIAREQGLDLRSIQGSGPGGRIVRADVEKGIKQEKPSGVDFVDFPLSRMRAAIAKNMAKSKREVPHFYLTGAIEMERALRLLEELKEITKEKEAKITLNDLILKACALALSVHPELNASFQEDAIRRFKTINLAIAVAVEGGLLTPVIARAGELSLLEIARKTKHLIEGAKSGHLLESETQDATITVTNLGAFGVESFQAIINPPQGAILAVGAVQKEASKLMRATLSVDHRVADGVQAAKFLGEFKRLLENPLELLLEGRR
ncbi:MAG TPA: hypothetical protein DD435_07400 [Cyanobacteria bacterium UBA8530]|nr:hypothetical protein [Cyanobacteria bacterium UBA8530]